MPCGVRSTFRFVLTAVTVASPWNVTDSRRYLKTVNEPNSFAPWASWSARRGRRRTWAFVIQSFDAGDRRAGDDPRAGRRRQDGGDHDDEGDRNEAAHPEEASERG